MAASRSAARCYEHFVVFLIRCNLMNNSGKGLHAPVANGLAANLQYVDIREKPLLGRYRQLINERFTYEALTHKLAFDVQTLSITFSY
ncbi:MAG: hypothetical protein A4E58_00363 [Syntrophorhabdus sp. PtaB.Bin006]|nr:MAG: hypothetical protein A4E58_00363 [Syntrophorhabdus sp. PtaB.Bin006]